MAQHFGDLLSQRCFVGSSSLQLWKNAYKFLLSAWSVSALVKYCPVRSCLQLPTPWLPLLSILIPSISFFLLLSPLSLPLIYFIFIYFIFPESYLPPLTFSLTTSAIYHSVLQGHSFLHFFCHYPLPASFFLVLFASTSLPYFIFLYLYISIFLPPKFLYFPYWHPPLHSGSFKGHWLLQIFSRPSSRWSLPYIRAIFVITKGELLLWTGSSFTVWLTTRLCCPTSIIETDTNSFWAKTE